MRLPQRRSTDIVLEKSVEYSPMGHWRWSSVGQTTSSNMRIIAWGQRNTSPMNMFLKFNELLLNVQMLVVPYSVDSFLTFFKSAIFNVSAW